MVCLAEEQIVYEDDALIVLHKPAGVAVESARVTQPDLVSLLKTYLQQGGDTRQAGRDSDVRETGRSSDARQTGRNSGGHPPAVYTIHRLDQVVEGLVVFAKTKEAAGRLSAQLTDGTMQKQYLARVCGAPFKAGRARAEEGRAPAEESGTLTDYLVKDRKLNMARVVTKDAAAGKKKGRDGAPQKAVLHYRRISEDELLIDLVTGRFHQIRAQLAHAGMPIVGDVKYGAPQDDASAGAGGRRARGQIALCAVCLSFVHPVTKERLTFRCEPSGALFGSGARQGA